LPASTAAITTPGMIRSLLRAFAVEREYKIVPHGLRKNDVNSLLKTGYTAAETVVVSGQSLTLVERFARRRDTGKLTARAIEKLKGPGREQQNFGKLSWKGSFCLRYELTRRQKSPKAISSARWRV
jgi:hypothetical protein